ncbi:MAG TPA: TIGR01777 family oxidoreductase [Vicinamibacterales bacterium]|nr:TIGR01777 family oxidoreductase [Vicinamibacterales bacterium]
MRIVIPGGSGQVGTILARAFHRDGHDVVVLSRRPRPQLWRVTAWDGETLGEWRRDIDGSDVVINLTGRSVNCRYGAANRRAILESRVRSTHIVGEAIAAASSPPRVWLQASTATIYAHRFDVANDEATGILGGAEADAPPAWRFSIDVARAWERAFDEAVTPWTRKVALRSAMTLSPDAGGVFDTLLRLVRYGLGGRAGDGRQFMSWIHYEDFVRATRWLIARDDVDGVVNLAAPNPLPNADFMRELREAWGSRVGLPATEWMLELGALLLLRTETELILKSRRVVPVRLLDGGFRFAFPDWRDAARDLCRQWKAPRGACYDKRSVSADLTSVGQ